MFLQLRVFGKTNRRIWELKLLEITKRCLCKDIILALIAKYGTDFGVGYGTEFCGETIENLSMEERMTICNMAIEGGAKIGLIAPDEKRLLSMWLAANTLEEYGSRDQ